MKREITYSPNNKGYCIVCNFLLGFLNISFLFWSISLIFEQIETGWGYGTNMELLVLVPFIKFLFSLPILVMEIIFIVLSFFFKVTKRMYITNLIVFGLLVFQLVIIYLFIVF